MLASPNNGEVQPIAQGADTLKPAGTPKQTDSHGVSITHRVKARQLKGFASVMSSCLQCSAFFEVPKHSRPFAAAHVQQQVGLFVSECYLPAEAGSRHEIPMHPMSQAAGTLP